MFRDKLFYYLANYTLQHSFEKEIIKLLKNEKKLVIFDVGCYRGIFTKSMLDLIGNKKYKIYLFDINKKVKKYISYLLRLKNIYYNEVALSNKNGKANYNYNKFFEAAGSSLSSLVKNEATWNFTRKLVLLSRKEFVTYKVHTITLDSFVKKNKIKSIDILKIDTEGYDFNVIKSLGDEINNVEYIYFEHHFHDMLVKDYHLSDVHSYLRNFNFIKVFKIKMYFRKTFEYIYHNKTL